MIYITVSEANQDGRTTSLPFRRAIRIVGTAQELLGLERAILSARTMPEGWHADFESNDMASVTTIEIRKVAPPAWGIR